MTNTCSNDFSKRPTKNTAGNPEELRAPPPYYLLTTTSLLTYVCSTGQQPASRRACISSLRENSLALPLGAHSCLARSFESVFPTLSATFTRRLPMAGEAARPSCPSAPSPCCVWRIADASGGRHNGLSLLIHMAHIVAPPTTPRHAATALRRSAFLAGELLDLHTHCNHTHT